jgi:hypothetical protein
MSEPQATDPTAVILARMEVKLDNALSEQGRHATRLDKAERIQTEHGNRLVALETRAQAEDSHQGQKISSRAVLWTAVGAVFVGCSGLVALVTVLVR